MSETEKKRRASYRRRRRIALTTLAILLALVTLTTAIFGFTLYQLNKTLYIDYTEEGKVDYTVALKPNDFYDTATLPAGGAYIASLIDGVTAKFSYALQTEAQGVSYEYSYWLDTQLVITDKSTNAAIYNPTFPIKDKQTATQSAGTQLTISESAALNYAHYNELAESFIKKYDLTNVESNLVARMHVSVLSLCDEFREAEQNEYVITLSIPLTTKTVNVEMSSTVPNPESKILACENDFDRDLYVGAIKHGSITGVVLLVALILVALLTRNKDITYAIKVKKLLNAYRSFIQQISNPFDTAGYQVLHVSSFNEMLEIRDTINSPILMHENGDKTCTQFIIPTATSLLYLYELKVADYDEIYSATAAEEPVVEEPVVEEPVAKEPVVEEPVAEEPVAEEPVVEEPVVEEPVAEEPVAEEPVAEEPVAEEPIVEEPVVEAPVIEPAEEADEESAAYNFGTKYDYSFEAKLALADDEVKGYYRKIVMFAKSFGVKIARSWARERIYLGRSLFALITFKGKKLALAFAIDPKTADPKYHAFDLSGSKKFERTPMLMRVTSPRKLKFATDLLAELFGAAGLADKKLDVTVDYADHRTKDELLGAGLIRIEGMPAPVVKKAVAPVAEAPVPAVDTPVAINTPEIVEEMPTDDEEGGAYSFGTKYDYSFEAKLALADDEVKGYYRKIVMFAKSFGVKVARSWARERIYLGRSLFALITFKGKKLALAFAIDPKTADPKYHAFDMSGSKKFERTPMLMRVTSPRKLKFATDLLAELFGAADIADKKLDVTVDYADHRTREELLADGLIRIENR